MLFAGHVYLNFFLERHHYQHLKGVFGGCADHLKESLMTRASNFCYRAKSLLTPKASGIIGGKT
jgi:hypothetical protein